VRNEARNPATLSVLVAAMAALTVVGLLMRAIHGQCGGWTPLTSDRG
jgi:hypothetical protein